MREQFEKLPEIADSLSDHIVFIGNKYTTPNPSFYDLVNWLNGAWYAYQEQQKKIDGALDLACKHQYSNGERIYNEIKELLK